MSPTRIPGQRFFISLTRSSINTENDDGEQLSHCFIPDLQKTTVSSCIFTRMQAVLTKNKKIMHTHVYIK